MGVATKLRRAHQNLIADNPVEITIERVVRIREGGGWRQEATTVGTFIGRIYQENTGSRIDDDTVTTAGIRRDDARWGLLAPPTMTDTDDAEVDTDLRSDPQQRDTITTALGTFEVTEVYPRQDNGEVWGWQANLQRVK